MLICTNALFINIAKQINFVISFLVINISCLRLDTQNNDLRDDDEVHICTLINCQNVLVRSLLKDNIDIDTSALVYMYEGVFLIFFITIT